MLISAGRCTDSLNYIKYIEVTGTDDGYRLETGGFVPQRSRKLEPVNEEQYPGA